MLLLKRRASFVQLYEIAVAGMISLEEVLRSKNKSYQATAQWMLLGYHGMKAAPIQQSFSHAARHAYWPEPLPTPTIMQTPHFLPKGFFVALILATTADFPGLLPISTTKNLTKSCLIQ